MIVLASLSESLAMIDHRWWAIAVGSLLLAVTVVVFARLRFIQTRPIRACIVLSIVAHGLIFGSAQLLRLFEAPRFPGDNTIQFQLSMDEFTLESAEEEKAKDPQVLAEPDAVPEERESVPPTEQLAKSPEPAATPPLPDPSSFVMTEPAPALTPVPEAKYPDERSPVLDEPLEPAIVEPESAKGESNVAVSSVSPESNRVAKTEDAPPDAESPKRSIPKTTDLRPHLTEADRHRLADVPPQGKSSKPLAVARAEAGEWRHVSRSTDSRSTDSRSTDSRDTSGSRYELRDETTRTQSAKRRGGTESSEAAVEAALRWLVKNQEQDGGWSAAKHHAGRGGFVEGQLRRTTGLQADTGVTGLAMLALLGGGHSHQRGSHRKTVQRGLEYLCKQQREDGSLGGNSGSFAQMYCHGIATLALCEAYGMTQDDRIKSFTQRALDHTVRSQHRTTGGWRYYPGDPGDTSQFGWQLMVLESARAGGLDVPEKSRQLAHRFIAKVSSGAHHGFAAYRPGQRPTVSMSAEALACRSFLGVVDRQLQKEADDFIIRHAPGREKQNLYFWYYGTLALHQLDSEHWPAWNTALQNALIPTQRRDGRYAGSWDTNTVWGGVGGRVYSTSMAALCLEVYYRYAPMSELARRSRGSNRARMDRSSRRL